METLNNLAAVSFSQGRTEDALSRFHESLDVARRMDHQAAEATILNNIAVIHQRCGQVSDASKYFQLALEVARRIGDRRIEASAVKGLGRVRADT